MHQQLMAWLAFDQAMVVVHPRVVAAYMATPDKQQITRYCRYAFGQPAQVVQHHLRRSLHSFAGSRQTPSQISAQGAQIEAMRVLIKRFKRKLAGTFVAIAALAQRQVDHLRRCHGRFQFQFCTLGKGLRQANENFPVVQGACRLGQYGGSSR
ncbi:hypothetical protein D3C79_688990 [compost metagenome]